ncbi:MAG: hypothetical protein ACI4M5_02385 [Christensenellales bacterium]
MKKTVESLGVGDIAVSLAGHDKKKPCVVVKVVADDYVMIADGMRRLISNPKLKKVKHLQKKENSVELTSLIGIGQADDKKIAEVLEKYISNKNGGGYA